MIDEVLRQKMGQALEEGRYDEALELSVSLDEQILQAQRANLKKSIETY